MLKRLALTSYNPNKPAELVKVRNALVPKILDFLARECDMPKAQLLVTVQLFDSLPNFGVEKGWKNFQGATRTRNPNKNELIDITCYQQAFPVKLRQFIFQQNYGHWFNAPQKALSDDPKDATSGILSQACTPSFITLSMANWDRLLKEWPN